MAGGSEPDLPPSPDAAVLLIDWSRSMFTHRYAGAAKDAAIALNSLIRRAYPHVALYLVSFAYYAREIQPEDLPNLTWNEWSYGTNLQHAFMLSRELLSRHHRSRQVLLITDGGPTAFLEAPEIKFEEPPGPRLFDATLREVERCTAERIMINMFVLRGAGETIKFVERTAAINPGRVVYTAPERLAEDIAESLPALALDRGGSG
jgi:uncharacterized protein with von Willebrand factor type A (vWA) domain